MAWTTEYERKSGKGAAFLQNEVIGEKLWHEGKEKGEGLLLYEEHRERMG